MNDNKTNKDVFEHHNILVHEINFENVEILDQTTMV